MEVYIITPFPDTINVLIENNISNQGIKKGLLKIETVNLRDFTYDNYKKIDDEPYGGGSGMVMMCQPLFDAIEYCISKSKEKPKIIFPSPKGKVLNHKISSELSNESSLIFICGHYKGIDQRVREHLITKEISIGDYVLSGGEIPAAVFCDTIIRLIPGVLNDETSALSDSFQDDLLAPPVYTRPSSFNGWTVPKVLTSGNLKEIEKWRFEKSIEITKKRRPDLLK